MHLEDNKFREEQIKAEQEPHSQFFKFFNVFLLTDQDTYTKLEHVHSDFSIFNIQIFIVPINYLETIHSLSCQLNNWTVNI